MQMHLKILGREQVRSKYFNHSMAMVSFSLFVKKCLVLTKIYRKIFLIFTIIFLQQKEIDGWINLTSSLGKQMTK